jgi:type I restriction enzyme S subunit
MMSSLQSTVYGNFAADYESSRLVDICEPKEGVQTGPFGSQLHQEDYVPVGTPIITVEHLGENRILHSDIPRVSEEDRERLSKYTLLKGDIVFSRVGSVDRRALVRDEEDGWLFSGRCLRVRPNQSLIDPGYLSYFFGLPTFKEYIRAIAVGATMPSLNTKILSDVSIYYPPLPEQRAIAHILGTLDDKIELNRRMNETLEAMARAIFKSWFVDFDPVRAKAEGRDTGLSEEIADLFPDSFEETELGEVPMGWKVGSLDDALILQRGFDLPTPKRTPGPYPVIAASGPSGTHNVFMVRGPGVTTGRSGVLGKVYYVHDDFWPLNTSLWVKEFKHVTPAYTFRLLSLLDLSSFNSGSAVPTLNRNHIHNLKIVLPPIEIIQAFDSVVVTFLKQQQAVDSESRTLIELHDTLLPKLISGELRVKNAEHAI